MRHWTTDYGCLVLANGALRIPLEAIDVVYPADATPNFPADMDDAVFVRVGLVVIKITGFYGCVDEASDELRRAVNRRRKLAAKEQGA